LAQVAEQLERDAGLDPDVATLNAEHYENLLRQALNEMTRRAVGALTVRYNAELDKQRSHIRAWRRRRRSCERPPIASLSPRRKRRCAEPRPTTSRWRITPRRC
jgi:hypothetical protein